MKKKMVFGAMLFVLFVLQAQNVFANNHRHNLRFRDELGSNNLHGIERFLQRRANRMDLSRAMADTIISGRISEHNRIEVFRLLLRHGADVNRGFLFSNGFSGTPLELAVSLDRPIALIQFLLDSGARIDLVTTRWDRVHWLTGLPLIRVAYDNGNMDVVNLLLDRGANGEILLPFLAADGNNGVITQLINRGVSVRSDLGAEALRRAARSGQLYTVALLWQNGVNINARNANGETALHIAYDRGEMEIHDFLLQAGAVEFERREVAAQPVTPAAQPTTVIVQQPAPTPTPQAQTPQTRIYAITVHFHDRDGNLRTSPHLITASSAREAERLAREQWLRSPLGLPALGNTFIRATAPTGSR